MKYEIKGQEMNMGTSDMAAFPLISQCHCQGWVSHECNICT